MSGFSLGKKGNNLVTLDLPCHMATNNWNHRDVLAPSHHPLSSVLQAHLRNTGALEPYPQFKIPLASFQVSVCRNPDLAIVLKENVFQV